MRYEVGRHAGPALKASRLGRMIGEARWERGGVLPAGRVYLGRASLLLLGFLIGAAALALAARYAVRHREQVLAAARRDRSAAPVRAVERPVASVLATWSRRAGAVPSSSAGIAASLGAVAVLAMIFAHVFDNVLDG